MATKSRTYKPSDWQLWTYTPVAGKFRLDFSTLGGTDVLGGSSDTGSIQVSPLRIASIQLDDGQRPDQGVFSIFSPGTMALSAQLLAWSDTTVKELYNGKQVFLTLKNEATYSIPTFGKNTIYFMGQIDALEISVDPINKITNLTISATDFSGAAMNAPITVTRSTTKSVALASALADARDSGVISSYLNFSLLGSNVGTWESTAATTVTSTFGSVMEDYIQTNLPFIYCGYYQDNSGTIQRKITGDTFIPNTKTGRLIPESLTSNMVISQDLANLPTAFDLSNSTSNYSFGINSASILSNPTIYSAQIDTNALTLTDIATTIKKFVSAIQPIEVTIRTAQAFQSITFDNTFYGYDYFYPTNHYWNGQEVKTTPSYTGETYYHQVVGTSHTITPDDWQTTYQLWKGLDPAVLPTNYVNNGSATSTTDLSNWYGSSRTTAQFNTTPASWIANYNPDLDYNASFEKSAALTLSTYYSLSFWLRNSVAGTAVTITFNAGDTVGSLTVTPSATAWTYYKIENIQCLGTTLLRVNWNAVNTYYIDDVWVVSGPTAY